MNSAAFPSPTAEMAEMNRIHYELEYTEGISQRMRIPEMLNVGSHSFREPDAGLQESLHSVMMQVPERIVVAGDSDPQYTRPRDLDLIQSTPLEALSLKTPPRVLTLNERPLDFMEEDRSAAPAPPSEELQSQGRLRRERSVSENTPMRHSSQLIRNDSTACPSPPAPVRPCPPLAVAEDEQHLYSPNGVLSFIQSTTRRAYQQVLEVLDENQRSKPSLRGGSASSSIPLQESRLALPTLDTSLEGGPDDMTVVDAATLRRQLIKLNRRLQLLEEENKERAKREMILYSVTVAFWLINSWVWFRR